jgi:hypothetical protein
VALVVVLGALGLSWLLGLAQYGVTVLGAYAGWLAALCGSCGVLASVFGTSAGFLHHAFLSLSRKVRQHHTLLLTGCMKLLMPMQILLACVPPMQQPG